MTNSEIASLGSRDLDEIVRETRRLYATADSKRLVWDLWFHTCHHVAALAKAVRNDRPEEICNRELADSALWLFTFVGRASEPGLMPEAGEQPSVQTLIKVSGTLSDMLWLRYPGACPTCMAEYSERGKSQEIRKCRCPSQLSDEVDSADVLRERQDVLRRIGAENAARRPESIDAWQELLAVIFHSVQLERRKQDLGVLLAEQAGFVSDTIVRLYSYTVTKPPAKEEVRWRQVWFEFEISRLTNLLFLMASKGGEQLSAVIGGRYGQHSKAEMSCPYCKRTECNCEILIAPFDFSVLELRKRMVG